MSELDAFEAEVRKNIKLLSSEDAKVRRKAALWLGEAGDPSAITRLRQIYKEDSDRSVADAAEYSLGMFRALERALDSDDSDAVLQRLENIAVKGQRGRRARFRASSVYRLVLGLIVSLIILLVFNFVLWPILEPQLGSLGIGAASTEGEGGRAVLLSDVSAYVANLRADANALQQQYQAVLGGSTVNCDATFTNPASFDASRAAGESDIAAIIERANTALTNLADAKTAFVQACPPNSTPLTTAEIGVPLSKLTPVLAALTEIETTLAATGGGIAPTQSATQETTAEPTTVEATATPSYDVTPHVDALNALINRMEGTGGANAMLTQYWADARSTGATGGCGQAKPTIPADYVLPEAEIAQAPESLTLAISLVNGGLEFVRRGWDQFAQACSANNLGAALEVGTGMTNGATSAFTNAKTILDELSAS